jgi:hypothetical protein
VCVCLCRYWDFFNIRLFTHKCELQVVKHSLSASSSIALYSHWLELLSPQLLPSKHREVYWPHPDSASFFPGRFRSRLRLRHPLSPDSVYGTFSQLTGLPANYPYVSSCTSSGAPSTGTYEWSRYSPVTTIFCISALGRTSSSPRSTIPPAVFCGAVVRNGAKGAIHGVPVLNLFLLSTVFACVHSQITRPSPHSDSRCKVVSCPPHWL